jgi:hypothetical protein
MASNQRIQIGSTTYRITSGATPAGQSTPAHSKQPFSMHVNRSGNVEITFNRAAKPAVNVSHAVGHSVRHDERGSSSSARNPNPPRSDVATVGSSTYLQVPTQTLQYTHASNGHSERQHARHHEHKPSSPRHQTHAVSSSSRSPQDASRRLLDAPNDRQRHTSPRVERKSIPIISSSSSPQRHAHFALPHSMPNQSNLVERIPPLPQQPSRHRYTHSHESYFRHRPQGWYNRRGDQFIQRGVIKRQPKHLEWDVVFAKYPEPGTGWMDAEGHYLPPTGGILKHSP